MGLEMIVLPGRKSSVAAAEGEGERNRDTYISIDRNISDVAKSEFITSEVQLESFVDNGLCDDDTAGRVYDKEVYTYNTCQMELEMNMLSGRKYSVDAAEGEGERDIETYMSLDRNISDIVKCEFIASDMQTETFVDNGLFDEDRRREVHGEEIYTYNTCQMELPCDAGGDEDVINGRDIISTFDICHETGNCKQMLCGNKVLQLSD